MVIKRTVCRASVLFSFTTVQIGPTDELFAVQTNKLRLQACNFGQQANQLRLQAYKQGQQANCLRLQACKRGVQAGC